MQLLWDPLGLVEEQFGGLFGIWGLLGGLWGWSWVSLGGSSGYLGRFAAHEALKKCQRSSEELPGMGPRGPKTPQKAAEKVPRDFY